MPLKPIQNNVTSDKAVVLEAIKSINMTMFTRWNRYRDGLATAVNRLKDSKAKSKVIIL
jgi:Ca-activated chloride channel family protein